MDITMVKVYPVQEDKLKAFVSVVFDQCFMVNDIKVIQGKDGLFLSMPSRRKKSGEFKDVAHPLNSSTRRMIEERVLSEYRRISQDPTPRRPDRELEDELAERRQAANSNPPVGPASSEPVLPAVAAHSVGGNGSVPAAGVPAAGVPAAGAPAAARPAASSDASEAIAAATDQTLEEVQEAHLSDSFWSFS